ncbi:rotatin isoform X1 [Alosa sapidissima]|uniref:rotatin isoform X1 n=1 Tax=Alosa sapidissima TaxID=34773 RepID=UPI001C0A055C|nr:rotatin isoform X1 [Alosa sapidissima]
MDLSALIKKLGHSLVEIRVRALKNIKSKLDHGLISVSDLVQERTLFVFLLEWFNFPEVPLQEEVLQLLSILSKHSTAAHMLMDVGAVEFLTQLSPSVEKELQAIIDSIIDQLFHLPKIPQVSSALTSDYEQQFTSTAVQMEEECLARGYFQRSRPNQLDIPPQQGTASKAIRCLKFSVFPWLSLTPTDRHILSSSESSLRKNDPGSVCTTCELLRDVIMQDFPAEIFLQRPSIVQSLLSLLSLSAESEASYLTLQALACLRQLCCNLRSRLRFHRDPGFCSAKQDPVSQNSSVSYSQEVRGTQRGSVASSPERSGSPRPSALGRTGQRVRGDGQDGDAASSSGSSGSQGGGSASPGPPLQSPQVPGGPPEQPELEVQEEALELQVQQWSLAQFSVAALEHALPLLRTESVRVFQRTLELLSAVLPLLQDSVSEELWDELSLTALELKEKIQGCMEGLADILCYRNSQMSEEQEASLVFHRMTYTSTAVFTIRLLQTLIPVEKANKNLPENLVVTIFFLCLDSPFAEAFPSTHESAGAYLELASPDSHGLFRRVSWAAHSMEATCAFLKEAEAEGEKNWLELLELAEQAVDGLPYHQHLPVVKETVQICSYLWKFAQASPMLRSQSQEVYLKLLSHPLLPVKTECYTWTLNIVKECLGVQNVAKPVSSVSSGVHFVLHARVLYEICTFGLQDQAGKVKSAAKDILLYLLKGRLMMTAATWSKLNEALYPVIPVLQSYAGSDDALGNCILLISEPSGEASVGMSSHAAKLRAALRLLFSKHQAARAAAVQHLIPHLTGADGASSSRPALESSAMSQLPSLYLLSLAVDLRLDTTDKSFLKVDSVNKLYNIFTSETVDLVLRRSAVEQLVVILQDTAMHAALKSLGIVEKVISVISDIVNNAMKNTDCLLEPSLSVLRKLVYADPTLRHSLAQKPPLLLTLLRASLILREGGEGGVVEVAALMALLLFDEIATVDVWTDRADGSPETSLSSFSLPVSVIRRYNLPFQPASHHVVSPYCCVLPPYADLVSLKPAWHMLQLAWNRAWHSGIDNLLEELRGNGSDVPKFHGDLVLSATQAVLLRVSHIRQGLQDCVQAVLTAGCHGQAGLALARMRLYLLTDQLALKQGAHNSPALLRGLSWQQALERFLQVQPACAEDERLLGEIVAFLNAFFSQHQPESASHSDDPDLRWILQLLLKQEPSTLLNLLLHSESSSHTQPHTHPPPNTRADEEGEEETRALVSQRLQREMTGLLITLMQLLQHTCDSVCVTLASVLESVLAQRLLQRLRVSEAPRFYGLPSLERTLRSMKHLTALPGWSTHSPQQELDTHTLCLKYLSGLLEVISSFYVEWGGNSMSFMGKGVTKNAIICLLHLSHEMIAQSRDKDWMSHWCLSQEQRAEEQTTARLELTWLIPLWVDRDPEVRFASLGVGSALSSLDTGCMALASSCQNISGGLWGTLLNILLESNESSMVRREAAFILQNLLVMPMPANSEEAKSCAWQHPCVHDEASGVSLVGLPALQALLYHCQFFQHATQMAQTCYRGRHAFDLNFPPGAPSHHSEDAEDLSDSLRHWRGPSAQRSHSQASGSLSTSSTLIQPGGSSGVHTPALSSSLALAQHSPVNRLTAQGQSDADSSDSVLSQDSRVSEACVERSVSGAVVTPPLVSAFCGVLANLLAVLPEFTLTALTLHQVLPAMASVVDAVAIERCVSELKTPTLLPGDEEDAKNQVCSLLQYVGVFCELLQSVASLQAELIPQLDFLKPLLSHVFTLLTLSPAHLDSRTAGVLRHTWTVLLTLLATLVRRNTTALFPSVATAMHRHWHTFSATISLCVDQWSSEPSLYTAALHFLSVVLSEEAKRRDQEVTGQLTPDCRSRLAELLNGTPGEQLCELLLQRYEATLPHDQLRKPTAAAFTALLACSSSAQSYACKAGLVDTTVEQMRQIHTYLNLESLKPTKAALRNKKEENYLKELKMDLELLRNCLYQHSECKTAATDSRLAAILYALWPWLLLDDPCMTSALELLCVYTANCSAACSAVCGGSGGCPAGVSGSGQAAVLPRGPLTNSLMHGVMKLASQASPDAGSSQSHIQSLAFCLLANLAISRDCKGILQKSNFLQNFPTAHLPRPGRRSSSSSAGSLAALWLRLLLNVSFGEDGQQTLLKLHGSLELLTELAQNQRPSQNQNQRQAATRPKPAALLILHNICFSSANKPKVLANDKTVGLLVSCLDSDFLDVRAIGASALWALLHSYQKAKVALKYPSFRLKVDEMYLEVKKDAELKKSEPLTSYLLKCLENLKQILNV